MSRKFTDDEIEISRNIFDLRTRLDRSVEPNLCGYIALAYRAALQISSALVAGLKPKRKSIYQAYNLMMIKIVQKERKKKNLNTFRART